MEETVEMKATDTELTIVNYCIISCFTSSQVVGEAAAYVVIVDHCYIETPFI